MEESILNYLTKNQRKIAIAKLIRILKIKGEHTLAEFYHVLQKLEEEAKIINLHDEVMIFPKKSSYHEGIIRFKKSHNAYIDNYIIPKGMANGALNGDLVLIVESDKKYDDKTIAIVKKIIKRKKEVIHCIYKDNNLIAFNEPLDCLISVPKKQLEALNDGEIVSVRINKSLENKTLVGEIINIAIDKNERNYAEKLIALNHSFPIEFKEETLKELENIDSIIDSSEIQSRLDLRESLIFTIDGDYTKDMDDAVSIKRLENSNYELGVHIAHVSHYVKRGTSLWKEAEERATSLYLNNSVFPMLPPKLSNDICSLNPNEDRLTLSTIMEIDRAGNIINFTTTPSIIRSRAKLTYSNVNKFLEDKIDTIGDNDIKNALKDMAELSMILQNQKEKRGCLNFASSELDVEYDENDQALDIKHHKQRTAETIIENFMLAANESLAINYSWMPFLYRVHDKPKEEELLGVLDFIRKNYIYVPRLKNLSNRSLQQLLKSFEDSENYRDISALILPTMPRAKFSTNNSEHFGLALSYYSQGTSPIRRFNDLVNQSLIDISNSIDKINIDKLEKYLVTIATRCSEREKEADKAEQEANKILMANYIKKHIGESFTARIIGIFPTHLCIETDTNIKGIVPINMIIGQNYQYDIKGMRYIGRTKKDTIRLGDRVLLKLNEVQESIGLIKFEMIKKLDNREYKERRLTLKDN